MTPEVVAHGEVLIDLSQHGPGPMGYPAYEALPGGGVANLAVALGRWGHRVGFSGRVGADALGTLLRKVLEDGKVDTSRLTSDFPPTTMAIVSLDAHGDRSFDFLWQGTSCAGLPVALARPTGQADKAQLPKVFHFSTVSMCEPVGFANNLTSARSHKEAGVAISFDPNFRPRLWEKPDEARRAIHEGLALADIVKISEEEVAFALGEPAGDPLEQAKKLRAQLAKGKTQPALLFVTLGPQGCLWNCGGEWGRQTPPPVKVVDTTGAGDCFMAGVLHSLLVLGKAPSQVLPAEAAALAAFGVKTGSLATTKRGGIPSIPTLEEVKVDKGVSHG
ncbi:MAG: carbohydrate kinase [Spirochaetales bacterium]